MELKDKYFLYGAGALMAILLAQKIIHNRNTKVSVNFDSIVMPNRLKPPKLLKQGDVIPKPSLRKMALTGIYFKKRFDSNRIF